MRTCKASFHRGAECKAITRLNGIGEEQNFPVQVVMEESVYPRMKNVEEKVVYDHKQGADSLRLILSHGCVGVGLSYADVSER